MFDYEDMELDYLQNDIEKEISEHGGTPDNSGRINKEEKIKCIRRNFEKLRRCYSNHISGLLEEIKDLEETQCHMA